MQDFSSGERGIRTLGDISATFDFESSALDQLSHLSNDEVGVLWGDRGTMSSGFCACKNI